MKIGNSEKQMSFCLDCNMGNCSALPTQVGDLTTDERSEGLCDIQDALISYHTGGKMIIVNKNCENLQFTGSLKKV